MTNQEMFDRAWSGLKSQNWQPARAYSTCAYVLTIQAGDELELRRCAWGWVDPHGTSRVNASGEIEEVMCGTIRDLRDERVGIAAKLEGDQYRLAQALQEAHDGTGTVNNTAPSGDKMRDNFVSVATQWGLEIPA